MSESGTGAPGSTDTGDPQVPGGSTGSDGASAGMGETSGTTGAAVTCDEEELSALYERYVEPFVSGTAPQSCSQCHMTGIDMSMYAQDTPCATMACMMDMNVVDLSQPEQSPLLSQIMMGDPNSSVFSVSKEHDAMLEWIEWSAKCHGEVCGDVQSACEAGTGAGSTGKSPIGDCSEDDLLVAFWDAVIVDRGRCLSCHSDWGQQQATFGACQSSDDCEGEQECYDGTCYAPGPYTAPHFFEGQEGELDFSDPQERQLGLNTMYNVIALGLLDVEEPLQSKMLTKPLLEDFSPTAVVGNGFKLEGIAPPMGEGIVHGGSSKFSFGCYEPPCPTAAPVDCRTATPCGDLGCSEGETCMDGYCRLAGSVCDQTYVNYVEFVEYFASCKGGG